MEIIPLKTAGMRETPKPEKFSAWDCGENIRIPKKVIMEGDRP